MVKLNIPPSIERELQVSTPYGFLLALNWYTERILQAIGAQLNTLFSRQIKRGEF